ncbi:small leucine-rich protein 1 [Octodon degus]|uniref:Small leucine-rich protein 1 n=1 Tax=Octodon degus TaxID=10160 RepID=A0A6P6EDA5_OCTDE|nr:small leucine-rich protein 1 [Octodon degus]
MPVRDLRLPSAWVCRIADTRCSLWGPRWPYPVMDGTKEGTQKILCFQTYYISMTKQSPRKLPEAGLSPGQSPRRGNAEPSSRPALVPGPSAMQSAVGSVLSAFLRELPGGLLLAGLFLPGALLLFLLIACFRASLLEVNGELPLTPDGQSKCKGCFSLSQQMKRR